MRCLIVHNPRSGFGSDAVFAFERELVHAGDECLLRELGDGFVAEEALADAEDYDVVVLSGGDGTVSSLLYALRDRAVTTCVFPSGTANLLFANIGNSPEPSALARACRWGDTVRCDLGEMLWHTKDGEQHRRGFSIMAGSGYDAELMNAAAPNKRAMGEAAYFMAALADPTPRVIHYVIEIDGTRVERDGIACIVANNAMIQGDIEIIPGCVMDDGLLDVIVLEVGDAVQLVRPFLAGIFDRKGKDIGRPHIESFRGRDIHVSASADIPMQIDGEVIEGTVTSWQARVLPGANNLVVDGLSRYRDSNARTTPKFPVDEELAFPK